MNAAAGRPAEQSIGYAKWRRPAIGRAANGFVLAAGDIATILILVLPGGEWGAADIGLTLAVLASAVGVVVTPLIGAANIAALRAARNGASAAPARRLARAGLWLTVARLVALCAAVGLVAAATDPSADGRWQIDYGFVGLAILLALFAFALAVVTVRNPPP